MRGKLVAVLFIFAICISTTPVQAYTNHEHNFSIGPPNGWTVDDTGYYGAVVIFRGPKEEGFTVNVNIQVEDLPEGTTLSQYVEGVLDNANRTLSNFSLSSEASRNIDNIDAKELAYTFDYSGSYHFKAKQVVIVKNDKAFNIVYTALQTTYDKYLAAFDSSVETFTNSTGVQFMGLDWWLWTVIITVIAVVVAFGAVVHRRRKSPSVPPVQTHLNHDCSISMLWKYVNQVLIGRIAQYLRGERKC